MILAEARLPNAASVQASAGVAVVVEAIKNLGLEIAAAKTEVMGFRKLTPHRFIKTRSEIDGIKINPWYQMKYLGCVGWKVALLRPFQVGR